MTSAIPAIRNPSGGETSDTEGIDPKNDTGRRGSGGDRGPAGSSAAGMPDKTGVTFGMVTEVVGSRRRCIAPTVSFTGQRYRGGGRGTTVVAEREAKRAGCSPLTGSSEEKEKASKAHIAIKGSSPELGETTMTPERATVQPTRKADKPLFLSDALSTTGTFLGGSIVAIPYGIYKGIEIVGITPGTVQADNATPALGSAAGVMDKTGVTPGPEADVVADSGGKPNHLQSLRRKSGKKMRRRSRDSRLVLEEKLKCPLQPCHRTEPALKAQIARKIASEGTVQASSATPAPDRRQA